MPWGLSAGKGRYRGIVEHQCNCKELNHMASGNNMKAAEETYSIFVGIVKWGSIITAATVAVVILLIA